MRETMLEEILRSGFSELGLELDGRAVERYRIYYENLEETNKVMNLTAISGEADVARLHFLDCAALLGMQDFAGSRGLSRPCAEDSLSGYAAHAARQSR